MKWTLPLLLALLSPALAACGGPDGRHAEAAGAYRLDKDAMRAPWLAAYDGMVDAKLATLPTAALREHERPQAEAAKAKLRAQFEKLDVSLVLGADGTWTLTGAALEGPIQREGTWSLSEDVVTFVDTSRRGRPKRDTTTSARYADGVLRMRPEPGLPEQMIFRRE